MIQEEEEFLFLKIFNQLGLKVNISLIQWIFLECYKVIH